MRHMARLAWQGRVSRFLPTTSDAKIWNRSFSFPILAASRRATPLNERRAIFLLDNPRTLNASFAGRLAEWPTQVQQLFPGAGVDFS